MTLNREEVFGPVAGVIAVDTYDAALACANDTPFGICAGVCTTSLKLASHFKRNSQAGMVMINLPTAGVDYHVPFGVARHRVTGRRAGPLRRRVLHHRQDDVHQSRLGEISQTQAREVPGLKARLSRTCRAPRKFRLFLPVATLCGIEQRPVQVQAKVSHWLRPGSDQ